MHENNVLLCFEVPAEVPRELNLYVSHQVFTPDTFSVLYMI